MTTTLHVPPSSNSNHSGHAQHQHHAQRHANPDISARYFKQFWKSAVEHLRVKSIKFGVLSERDIDQLSHKQITSSTIYNPETLEEQENGPLDPHLGCSSNNQVCATCHLSARDCVGHFGHIDLVLPCFHIGFIKDVIQILHMICKQCSRVLLDPKAPVSTPTNPNYWRTRMSQCPSREQYHKYLKCIIGFCKKTRHCPYCGELNGTVKKHNKSFRILHDKYTAAALRSDDWYETLELYDNIVEYESRYASSAAASSSSSKESARLVAAVGGNSTQDLMPWDVLRLFEQVRRDDHVLIGLRFAEHGPRHLILTKLPVPPTALRPAAKLHDDKANDDDLTIQLQKIIECNRGLKNAMHDGNRNISHVIETFFFLNKNISEYYLSELPGYPVSTPRKTFGGGVSNLAGTRSRNTKGKKIRSFSDRLKGKFGRFRGNLSGKRVNFSGRTVISPDPNLELDELGVPLEVCRMLTFTEMATKHNIHWLRRLILNGPDVHPGAITYGQRLWNSEDDTDDDSQFRSLSLKKLAFRLNIADNLLKYGDRVERHLCDGDLVLFNRQPSLHRVSIMCHRVKAVPFRTFRFNPCCCNPYNADFDGDEMNIHVPQTLMARAEALLLLNVTQNFAAPKSADPLVVPLQDIITATYLLTLKRVLFTRHEFVQLVGFMDHACLPHHYVLPTPAILKPLRLWTGKQVFSMILNTCAGGDKGNAPLVNLESKARNAPSGGASFFHPMDGHVVIHNSELMCGNIDKNILGSTTSGLFFRLLRDYGSRYTAQCMNRLTRVATRFLQQYGFSVGISDVTPTPQLKRRCSALIDAGYAECATYLRQFDAGELAADPGCNEADTLESRMNVRLSQIREDAGKACIEQLSYDHNAPLIMAECGSKGSKINISQMVACVGQQTVSGSRVGHQFVHRSLPHFGLHAKTAKANGFVENSFFSGITATEFFYHTMGGREGLVDTAVKTAETGYMQRRLMKNIEDVVIGYDSTVRNCKQNVVQFRFGHDGVDPMHCETESVVNFHAVLRNIRNQRHRRHQKQNKQQPAAEREPCLNPTDMRRLCADSVASVFKPVENALFKQQLLQFVEHRIYEPALAFVDQQEQEEPSRWYDQLYGLTELELRQFVDTVYRCYDGCLMEPGSAVGGVSATSLGEPATQMTLKTFHFAGVASMNITQGVPRIREIINATPNISTPVMTCQLQVTDVESVARTVKARIDTCKLGAIVCWIQMVIRPKKTYIECKLNLRKMSLLYLQLSNRAIGQLIMANLKRLLPRNVGGVKHGIGAKDIRVAVKNDDLIRLQPHGQSAFLGFVLHHLMSTLPTVPIQGIENVTRVIIHKKKIALKRQQLTRQLIGQALYMEERLVTVVDVDTQHAMLDVEDTHTREQLMNVGFSRLECAVHELYVEGRQCLDRVLGIAGIKATETMSNDIIEVAKVLGIEAANQTIITELNNVYSSHGLHVDKRHLMLVADLMTSTGNVLGFSRHGMMGKEDKSILTMASYEETVKHLFLAALQGEESQICGVSDSIIMGAPVPIGTGACSVLRDVNRKQVLAKTPPLIFGRCPLNAMTNNDIIVTT